MNLQKRITDKMTEIITDKSLSDEQKSRMIPEFVVKELLPDEVLDKHLKMITENEIKKNLTDDTSEPWQHLLVLQADGNWASKEKPDYSHTIVAFAGGGLQAGEDEQKSKIMRGLGAMFAEKSEGLPLLAVFLISEAWVYHAKAGEEVDMTKIPQEKKTESLIIAEVTLDRRNVSSMTPFVSTMKKKVRHLKFGKTEFNLTTNKDAHQVEPYILRHFYAGYFQKHFASQAKKAD